MSEFNNRGRSFLDSVCDPSTAPESSRGAVDPHEKGLSQLRGQFSQPLTVLMVMVAVVLLIACANLANLLLARGSARRREISIRMAIGASRSRVIRQLLTESVLLALTGGAVAVAIAWWGSGALFSTVAGTSSSLRLDLKPDLRTFAFTAAVSFVTALLFGLVRPCAPRAST